MRPFSLNDEEIWLITKLRSLTIAQHNVIHLLIRNMARPTAPLNVVVSPSKIRQTTE